MKPFLIGGACLFLAACAGAAQEPPIIVSKKSAVELRSVQARTFETNDKNKVLRATITTLVDCGYGITRVSADAGTVTASKAAQLALTASVYPHGDSQTIVRANAIVNLPTQSTQVDDPQFYRDLFFEPLARTLFLDALAAPDREEEAPPPQVLPINRESLRESGGSAASASPHTKP
jgi:hypothetical protein